MAITQAFRESTTLKLVIPCWLAVLFKFIAAGYDFGFGVTPSMGAVEFSAAVAAILAVWLGREWRVAHYAKQG
jgi:hypothetical protein